MDATRGTSAGAVLSASRIKASGEVIRIGQPTHAESCGTPKVRLVREADGVVRAIEITCSCGEVICIQCEYS